MRRGGRGSPNERTYLAWWRTGLTSLAVGIGIGRLVPQHSSDADWPYQLVGAGYGVLGIVFLVIGPRRLRLNDYAARSARDSSSRTR